MNNVFDSNQFNTIKYVPNSVVCQVSCQTTQVWTTLSEKVPKTLIKPQTRNIALNFKHINNLFDSNHFNTIKYIPNSVVCHVSRQITQVWTTLSKKVPKTLKKPQKWNVARNLKHMNIVFDSNHFNTITYTK